MSQKGFEKLRAGDPSLDDAPRSGRPAGVGSDEMETFVENSQCSTVWGMADMLKVSRSVK